LRELEALPSLPGVGYSEEIQRVENSLEELKNRRPSELAWKTVQLARDQHRPQTLDYLAVLDPHFVELHGDRLAGDDAAVVGGLASLEGRTVMVIGHQKGHDLKERQVRNFGMPQPSGYRKAQRLARLASRFRIPVLTLVDTPGAFPGIEAEQGGQAAAIAESMRVFARLDVPTVAVVIGEGGSGGALALALCDRVYMLENSIYSVISPEGCAAILWRDAGEAPQAAEALRLTAAETLELGVIDGVIPEPRRGARNARLMTRRLLRQFQAALEELEELEPTQRRQARVARFLDMGRFKAVEEE
jgi:acetyl-CoA carboxylase carboxyl transferase alpha subunit